MKKTTLTIILASIAAIVFAVPASPEPHIIQYLDGRSLTVYLNGDENFSWYETQDGLHIKKNLNGEFEYVKAYDQGQVVLSGVKAHDPLMRNTKDIRQIRKMPDIKSMPINISLKKTGLQKTQVKLSKSGLAQIQTDDPFGRTDFPTIGSRKFLCILVGFSDKNFVYSAEDFDSLFNAKDYTHNGAIGSVNEYYRKTSFDLFDPTFDVVGPVILDSTWSYYGKDENGNHDVNIQQFTYDALMAADDIVDYSDYDLDNDGYVDNVYFIYAGYGQASGASANTIWPHRWWLYSMNSQPLDGKYFGDYSTSNEIYGTSGSVLTSIGVICHEFGHVCGLPDFYDTDYGASGGDCDGLGHWDEMAGGSWNDGGRRPPMFNAWSRIYLNWATAQELNDFEPITMNPAYTSNDIHYFMADNTGEFFMMENRQQTGFDAALPGHGLLIYHVDMNHSGWHSNSLNNNPDRQGFDLEEADGFGNPSTGYDNAGDAFPGTRGNKFFTDMTNPNALDWSDNPSRSPLRNINEDSLGVITFMFGDLHIDGPKDVAISTQGYDSVTVSWDLNTQGDSVVIVWAEDSRLDYLENMRKYEIGESAAKGKVVYKGIDTVFYHTGLNKGVLQNYAIYSFNDSAYIYSEPTFKEITTNSPAFYETDFSEGIPEGWLITDISGNGTFGTANPLNRNIDSPTSENGFIVVDSEYAGDVSRIDAGLITQSFNFGLSKSVIIKFQHRLETSSMTLARLLYTINNGITWFEAARWTSSTDNTELVEIDMTAMTKGFKDVKFKFDYHGAKEKYWCFDDFMISSALDTGMVAGFHTANVRGLKPLTVNFMNTTVSEPDTVDSYVWEFGDNEQFNYEKAPTHTYTRSGTYTVTLATQKNGKTSYAIKTNYITVLNNAPILSDEKFDTLDVKINKAITYNLKDIFSDPNGDPMTFSLSLAPEDIAVGIVDDTLLVMTPNSEFLGMQSLELIAKDIENDSLVQSIDIWVSETAIPNGLPLEFSCSQNYPNPFNPVTSIDFQLPLSKQVTLNVYSVNGQLIKNLLNGYYDAGYYSIRFHGADLPSGMYLYRLTAGKEVITKKMLLMK